MKQLILIMAAIVCLATSALAQVADNQQLSQALWKQGVARCAHYTAYAKGFAKRSDEMRSRFPQGYTLDDLNDVYGKQGEKWEKIYEEFKKADGKSGSIEDLKELVTPQVWKLVEPDFKAFITDHPDLINAPAAPAEGDPSQEGDGDNVQLPPMSAIVASTALPPVTPTCPCGSASWVRCWACVPCSPH